MTCYTYKASASSTQDVIEYETLTSGQSVPFERRERLHEWLKAEDIEQLHQAFVNHPDHLLNFNELRAALLKLDISFTDPEFNRLFLKINQNRDFKCDWDEFISYLIFGFQEDDPATQKEALILPISTPPIVKKSEHRSAIVAITLMRGQEAAKVTPEEEMGDSGPGETPATIGMWVTASKEGQIKFWTPQLDPIRSGYSESIYLKMQTWILAIQAMSDVNIICTSSTERELRFHETIASTFSLRLVIRSVPFAVCCMSYNSHPKSNSRLVMGDFGGNVRILEFSPYQRGPFQSKPGAALIEVVWADILKGKLPLFIPHEHLNIHSELICKVYYSIRTSSLFSASEYRNTRKYRGRCPGLIITGSSETIMFRIPLGVTTFYYDDNENIMVTGGPDTFVRIWDIFIPSKPSGILTGHNSGIVCVFLQFEDKKVFSVDYQKTIKVWHLNEHTLLQTYGDLVFLMPNELDIVYNYNPKGRELLVAGRKFINIKCNPKVRTDLTDGNTHAGPVSVLLYNSLFRNLVTCGLDSYIIVWDPWSGKRKIIMKSCHTKQVYGETIDIEITAACFDPLEQFLLTGARDGSLKIWNYNNAVCIRNMSIKSEHEVTAVIWVVERILAVGWDQQVTEFNDAQGREYGDPKKWPKFHGDDITCADVKLGEGVVTGTYSGELIFWKLETGQPYRRYNVKDPRKFIELKYNSVEAEKLKKPTTDGEVHELNVSRFVRRSVSENIRHMEEELGANTQVPKGISEKMDEKEAVLLQSIRRQQASLPLSVQAVLFLQKRPMTKEHGSVFVALDNGKIQVYSHHQRGGYIDEFNSVHKTGDCVLTMTTDRKNRFLFTGTAFGYIKIWLIENYCVPESEKVHVSMPLLRLQFIFLRKERFITRAKRMVKNITEPLLVNSYKAHLQAINSVVFINLPKVLLSGSHDCSCRLWSIGGRYLGTLGTILPWKNLSPFDQPDESLVYRLPPEIKKVASSTTMKVISGVQIDKAKMKPMTKTEDENKEDEEEATNIYGKALREPILGKHFRLPGKAAQEQRIELNNSYSYIPVYTQLKVHDTQQIERPPTPPIINETMKEDYMEFYMPLETKIKDVVDNNADE